MCSFLTKFAIKIYPYSCKTRTEPGVPSFPQSSPLSTSTCGSAAVLLLTTLILIVIQSANGVHAAYVYSPTRRPRLPLISCQIVHQAEPTSSPLCSYFHIPTLIDVLFPSSPAHNPRILPFFSLHIVSICTDLDYTALTLTKLTPILLPIVPLTRKTY